MSARNLFGLMLIMTVAWVLILLESYIFIAVIRPLGPSIHFIFLPSTATKIILTAGLGVLWVGVMFAMDYLFARKTLKTPT